MKKISNTFTVFLVVLTLLIGGRNYADDANLELKTIADINTLAIIGIDFDEGIKNASHDKDENGDYTKYSFRYNGSQYYKKKKNTFTDEEKIMFEDIHDAFLKKVEATGIAVINQDVSNAQTVSLNVTYKSILNKKRANNNYQTPAFPVLHRFAQRRHNKTQKKLAADMCARLNVDAVATVTIKFGRAWHKRFGRPSPSILICGIEFLVVDKDGNRVLSSLILSSDDQIVVNRHNKKLFKNGVDYNPSTLSFYRSMTDKTIDLLETNQPFENSMYRVIDRPGLIETIIRAIPQALSQSQGASMPDFDASRFGP